MACYFNTEEKKKKLQVLKKSRDQFEGLKVFLRT